MKRLFHPQKVVTHSLRTATVVPYGLFFFFNVFFVNLFPALFFEIVSIWLRYFVLASLCLLLKTFILVEF